MIIVQLILLPLCTLNQHLSLYMELCHAVWILVELANPFSSMDSIEFNDAPTKSMQSKIIKVLKKLFGGFVALVLINLLVQREWGYSSKRLSIRHCKVTIICRHLHGTICAGKNYSTYFGRGPTGVLTRWRLLTAPMCPY